MNNLQKFIDKHSSAVLTGISIGGVIATSILSAKETPKAIELIEKAKNEKEDDLTKLEIIQTAWKPYIPAIISGFSTILCILGIHYLNKRTQASLISAYALLDNTYKEYKNKINELYPEDKKIVDFEHEIIKSKFDKNMKIDDEKELFFDYQSMRYFESTMSDVKSAEEHLNTCLSEDGYVCLNELYEYLDLPKTPYGWQLGWSYIASDKLYSENDISLKFEYDKVTMDDGLECTIITIKYPKSLEYIC